jgi:hypothetical protein
VGSTFQDSTCANRIPKVLSGMYPPLSGQGSLDEKVILLLSNWRQEDDEVIQAGYQSQYIKALLRENLDTADPVHPGFVRPDNKAGRAGVGIKWQHQYPPFLFHHYLWWTFLTREKMRELVGDD